MATRSSVLAGLVVALGLLALALLAVGGLVVMWAGLGMPALTALLVVSGVVVLARSLIPMRAVAWFKKPQADEQRIGSRILTMEAALAAGTFLVLAASASWWQPLLGVSVPLWIVVLLVVRNTALSTINALHQLNRPIAGLVLLLDILLVLPVAALLTRSFAGTVIASTVASCAFAALALRSITISRLAQKRGTKLEPAAIPEEELRDRWRLGTWLHTVQSGLRRPLIVAIGGALLAVPLAAALTVSTVLILPFVTAAATRPSRSLALRMLWGLVCAGAGVGFTHAYGPALYRAVFPDAFGDGMWLQVLAWCNLAAISTAVRGGAKRASQLRTGIAAAVSAVVLVGLGAAYGATGILWAIVVGSVIASIIGMTVEKSDQLAWD